MCRILNKKKTHNKITIDCITNCFKLGMIYNLFLGYVTRLKVTGWFPCLSFFISIHTVLYKKRGRLLSEFNPFL